MNKEIEEKEQAICEHLKKAWCISNGKVSPLGSGVVGLVNEARLVTGQLSNGRTYHIVDLDKKNEFFITLSYGPINDL